MARAGDVDRVEVARADRAVQVRVEEVQPGRRAPVAEQPRLDVLEAQRLAQQRVVEQVDLPDRQVVRGAPVGVEALAARRVRAARRRRESSSTGRRVRDVTERLRVVEVARSTRCRYTRPATFVGGQNSARRCVSRSSRGGCCASTPFPRVRSGARLAGRRRTRGWTAAAPRTAAIASAAASACSAASYPARHREGDRVAGRPTSAAGSTLPNVLLRMEPVGVVVDAGHRRARPRAAAAATTPTPLAGVQRCASAAPVR